MLSAKTEYAVRALLHLSLEYDRGAPVQGKRIASEERIPEGFLAQILGQLKRIGLVTSVRGACGGYRLATPPDRLTLGEAIEMIEGPPAERSTLVEPTPLAEALAEACDEAVGEQRAALGRRTLADLASRAGRRKSPMYYI